MDSVKDVAIDVDADFRREGIEAVVIAHWHFGWMSCWRRGCCYQQLQAESKGQKPYSC